MLRYRPYFDKEKASAWINSMADHGWALKGFSAGFWSFERCAPGAYRYTVDFDGLSEQGQQESTDYMNCPGVTTVGRWGSCIVLRHPAAEGTQQLYTDNTPAIGQRKKILTFFKAACIIELISFVLLCLVLVRETDWTWAAILATCAAGMLTFVFAIRCLQLKAEIQALQNGSEQPRTGPRVQRQ